MLSVPALAIGIGPPRVSIDFSPGLAQDLGYIVVNTIDQPIEAQLYVSGDLAQFITLSRQAVSLPPRGSEEFTAFVRLPQSIAPGGHDIRIGAVEAAPSGSTVGARAGVESQLIITAPFSGKLIRAGISVGNVELGSDALLHFEIESIGNETIEELQVVGEIADSAGSVVTEFSSEKRSLVPSQTAVIDLTWRPSQKGNYTARARVLYDGSEEQIAAAFRVGEVSVAIESIAVSPFQPGQIAKVSIGVRNEWDQRLEGVYATVNVEGDELAVAATGRSTSIDLEPFASGTLDAFIDTAALGNRPYSASAMVHFAGKFASRQFTLSPSGTASAEGSPLIIGLAVIIVCLAAALVLIKRRKRSAASAYSFS